MNLSLSSLLFSLSTYGMLLLAGQGVVYFLSFGKHETNAVYRLLRLIATPIVKPVRFITPKIIIDKHVPFVAFLILFWIAIAFSIFFGKASRGMAG